MPPGPDEVVLEYHKSEYNHLVGFTSTGGWLVKCGPFQKWWATPSIEVVDTVV